MEQNSAVLQYINTISSSRQAILSALSILSRQETTLSHLMNNSNNHTNPEINTILHTVRAANETLAPVPQYDIQSIALTELLSRAMARLVNRARPITTEMLSATQITNATETLLFSELPSHPNIDIYHSCPISYERFVKESEITRIIYCGHYFERDSIMRWLSINTHCPICRHDIRNNQPESSSQTTNNNDDETDSPMEDSNITVSEEIDQSLNNILDTLFVELTQASGQEQVDSVVFQLDFEPTPDVE